MDYKDYIAQVRQLAKIGATNTFFPTIIPGMIAYAEQRIYRELDLLSTLRTDATKAFTANIRTLTLPTTDHWVTVQQVNAITPAGTAADAGTRNPLTPVSRQFLNAVHGSATGAALPRYFAMQDDQTIVVGPWPDAAYKVEFVGTIRPEPLSPTNTTTFLSLWLPDVFVAASMIFVAGYQKNFGQMADDPKMAQSWEMQYGNLLASANAEEMRKKFAAPSPQPVRSE